MLETRCKYYKNEAMFHGFIPHIMGTRFDILLIHSDIDRLNTLWADILLRDHFALIRHYIKRLLQNTTS